MCGPKSPKGLFAGTQSSCGPANTAGPVSREAYDVQPKRQFAAQTPIRCRSQFAAQTPICSLNANLQPKRQFAADCQFAAQTPICILKAFLQPKRISAAPNACIPEVLPRTQCRACCQGSLRCAALKSPKGLLAGTQTRSGPAITAAPVAQNISLLVLVCVWLTDMVCVLRN